LLKRPTLLIFGIGSLADLFTSRWFVVRMLHWPATAVYRIATFLPLLMGLVLFGLLPILQTRGDNVDFAVLIGAAFGIGFSLDNGRAPSRYSRILGAVFLLLGVDWWHFGDGGGRILNVFALVVFRAGCRSGEF
jgi:hypothetical protein